MVAILKFKSHFLKRWALLSTKLSSWLICWSSKATFSKDGLFLALSLAHDCFLQVQKDIIWTIGRIQHPTWTNSFGFQDIKTVLWNVSKGTKTFSFWWYFNKNPQQKNDPGDTSNICVWRSADDVVLLRWETFSTKFRESVQNSCTRWFDLCSSNVLTVAFECVAKINRTKFQKLRESLGFLACKTD